MSHDLKALRTRILQAKSHGFVLAKTADYVAELGGGAPPPGCEANSSEHLLFLINDLETKALKAPLTSQGVTLMPSAVVINENITATMPEGTEPSEAVAPVAAAPVAKAGRKNR